MIRCPKCKGRMFVDRALVSYEHLEIYCMSCGTRKIYVNPQSQNKRIKWIMEMEIARAKTTGNRL